MREEAEPPAGSMPNEASAAAAVAALQSELTLADGNLDALDRKSALLPAFLAALAGLFIAMRARAQIPGPDVEEVVANLHLDIADFNAALAGSLADEIDDATGTALFKARWLNRAMILAVVTILFLSAGRVAGA